MDNKPNPLEELIVRRMLHADEPRPVGMTAVLNLVYRGEEVVVLSIQCPNGCCTANFSLDAEQAQLVGSGLVAAAEDAEVHTNSVVIEEPDAQG